jgi:hypothetical protein
MTENGYSDCESLDGPAGLDADELSRREISPSREIMLTAGQSGP